MEKQLQLIEQQKQQENYAKLQEEKRQMVE